MEGHAGRGASTISCGPITLDPESRILRRGETEHRLTPKLSSLLLTFLQHRGEVLTRQFLMKEVWDTDFVADTRTLEVHVSWLRGKIERDGRNPDMLHTVRGVGYVFRPRESSVADDAANAGELPSPAA
jgi:DNA-binding response OmpR family regulator